MSPRIYALGPIGVESQGRAGLPPKSLTSETFFFASEQFGDFKEGAFLGLAGFPNGFRVLSRAKRLVPGKGDPYTHLRLQKEGRASLTATLSRLICFIKSQGRHGGRSASMFGSWCA